MYLLGLDIGSSSIKAALVDAISGKPKKVVQYPENEMDIIARQSGWAEQQPEVWWENVCLAIQKLLLNSGVKSNHIKGIGIAYQMHGLVLVDKDNHPLRPAIIWCDSRAIEIGQQAFQDLGETFCLEHLLNSPGNFTASKLKWVKDNEPEIYQKIHKIMLPGDYIAMRLTGNICTTPSGLSEGIFWNFKNNELSKEILDYFNFDESLFPKILPACSFQGEISKTAADLTGLQVGTPVTYRAGDQPNNALSLNVLEPGEIAATGGTSGVVYGIIDQPVYDTASRVNGFCHVNHTSEKPRVGVLLCINGAGIQYSWIKHQIARANTSYNDMERMIASIPVGSEGIRILPFGNGKERMFPNCDIGSQIINLQFNRHTRAHMYRAALEGIAFSFVNGMEILKEMGFNLQVLRVGNDNLFQSKVFSNTIANLMDCHIEMVETTGAVGAARAAGLEIGYFTNLSEAVKEVGNISTFYPDGNEKYRQAFQIWKSDLNKMLYS